MVRFLCLNVVFLKVFHINSTHFLENFSFLRFWFSKMVGTRPQYFIKNHDFLRFEATFLESESLDRFDVAYYASIL